MDPTFAQTEARRQDLIGLRQDLIRIPTLNWPGDPCRTICDYLAARLRRVGFAAEFVRADGAPGDSDRYPRWNLIARLENGPGDCVHFNSHHDVVTVGHGWTRDPFGGIRDGDRIFGRGVCDRKGGLAASIIGTEAILAATPDWHGSIEIFATADEISGGYGSVAYRAEHGRFTDVRHVIIPEALHKDRICLGHRGVWWGRN